MPFKLNKQYGLLLISAIPITMSIQMVDSYLNWVVYAVAFYAFLDLDKPKEAFRRGAFLGGVTAILNFFWIISSASKFTGAGLIAGIAITLIFTILFALYAGLMGWIILLLKRKKPFKWEWLLNGVYLSALWVLVDSFMIYFAKGFALCLFVSYIPLAHNLYIIQLTMLTGPLLLTFIVIFLSYITAYFIYNKKWKMLFVPLAVILGCVTIGSLLLNNYEDNLEATAQQHKTVKAAILAQNIDPTFHWDPQNGDYLAKQFFLMNQQIAKSGSKLAIWAESAIPWNYTPNDAFLRVVDSITAPAGITHLIGMNTDYDRKNRIFYNSIYCINPHLKMAGRYDKRLALSLIEKPFLGLLIPFYNSTGFRVKEGTSDLPLTTPYGKAGMLLCNESAIPDLAYKSVRAGANFLVNPGNDGWFSDTYISRQHLFHARLRAVATRKDLIINNNDGYSGLIQSTGRMPSMNKSKGAMIGYADIRPNSGITFVVAHPHWFPILCLCIFLGFLLFNLGRTQKNVKETTIHHRLLDSYLYKYKSKYH